MARRITDSTKQWVRFFTWQSLFTYSRAGDRLTRRCGPFHSRRLDSSNALPQEQLANHIPEPRLARFLHHLQFLVPHNNRSALALSRALPNLLRLIWLSVGNVSSQCVLLNALRARCGGAIFWPNLKFWYLFETFTLLTRTGVRILPYFVVCGGDLERTDHESASTCDLSSSILTP